MSQLENPFASPEIGGLQAERKTLQRAPTRPSGRLALWGWPAVFALNMIVPGLFYPLAIEHEGNAMACHFALLLASLCLLIPGWFFCAARPKGGSALVRGALLIAVTQFFPMLQIYVGMMGIGIAGAIVPKFAFHNAVVVFLVTLFLGSVLIAASAVAGYIISLLFFPGHPFDENVPQGE